jgi:hypothetical protein
LGQTAERAIQGDALGGVELASHCVANAKARPILHRQPGVQYPRQLDDHKDHNQQHWQNQRELDQALRLHSAADLLLRVMVTCPYEPQQCHGYTILWRGIF